MKITKNTNIAFDNILADSLGIKTVLNNFRRDIEMVCDESEDSVDIKLIASSSLKDDQYEIYIDKSSLIVKGKTDIEVILGIYKVSELLLGIHPFWFWNDQHCEECKVLEIEDGYKYISSIPRVRYRGWFINDEVLLEKWDYAHSETLKWEMVIETLIRCGGNTIILGTDTNSLELEELVRKHGIYSTHHHAQPLGAEMFLRKYPGEKSSFDENPNLFLNLWEDAIKRQLASNVIWNVGFRGQGDRPFWLDDEKYETSESRGKVISDILQIQVDLVKKYDSNAIITTNIYGEVMELYKEGYIVVPDGVIKLWADNGYGKMVSRRSSNHNPRINSMPNVDRDGDNNGIYYHASFYDLQAANHITRLGLPYEEIRSELNGVINNKGNKLWMINASNIKPHIETLDYISKLWIEDISSESYLEQYTKSFYSSCASEVKVLLQKWEKTAVKYGYYNDEVAGDQFPNYVSRILINMLVTNKLDINHRLAWFCSSTSILDIIEKYESISDLAINNYKNLLNKIEKVKLKLNKLERIRLESSLEMQTKLMYFSFLGAKKVCESIKAFKENDYLVSFYYAGNAGEYYTKSDLAMRSSEHGKWDDFYQNDCLTDVKFTSIKLKALMSYIRCYEPGMNHIVWHRKFLHEQSESNIILLTNVENHVNDEKLYFEMKKIFEETNNGILV